MAKDPKKQTDLFADLEGLAISQDFISNGGGTTKLFRPSHRKPNKEIFFRVHPSYQITVGVIELKSAGGEVYLVLPNLCQELVSEGTFGTRTIVPWIDRGDEISLWALKLPSPDGRSNEWTSSVLEAVDLARKTWVRLVPNMRAGQYDIYTTKATTWSDPKWPDVSFEEMIRLAFKDRVITTLDHPILRELRGE